MKQRMIRMLTLAALVVSTMAATAQGTEGDAVTTVADEGESGMFVAALCPRKDVAINKNQADVYSIYTDKGNAYLSKMFIQANRYIVKSGDCVIIKTAAAETIPLEDTSVKRSSVWFSNVFCPAEDISVDDFLSTHSLGYRECIYLLTNMPSNGGFGFTKFTGDLMRKGNFFVIGRDKTPAAVKAVEAEGGEKASQGSAYDLLGRRISPAPGQLYIQNGRKFMAGSSQPAAVAQTRAAEVLEDSDPVPFLEGEAGNDDGFVAQTAYAAGDANGDGEVNVADIVETANYMSETPSARFIFSAADINRDKKVNATDIELNVANIMTAK